VLLARVADGVNVAVVPLDDTVPEIGVVPPNNVNEVAVIVEGSIAVLNVVLITPSSGTA
jgi:hypothetical protein